jgi:hypothetical protein
MAAAFVAMAPVYLFIHGTTRHVVRIVCGRELPAVSLRTRMKARILDMLEHNYALERGSLIHGIWAKYWNCFLIKSLANFVFMYRSGESDENML